MEIVLKRLTIVLACLVSGVLAPVIAAPPAKPPEVSPAAPAPAAETPAEPTSPEASTTTPQRSVTVTATAEKSQEQWERYLLAKGYHMEMRNGQKMFCRREDQLGTRLGNAKACSTSQTLKASEDRAQEAAHDIQKSSKRPVT